MYIGASIERVSETHLLGFSVPFLVSYISRFMTLLPGDVVATGTPSVVAMGMEPPQWLKPGDLIEMGIDGIGCSRRRVVAG